MQGLPPESEDSRWTSWRFIHEPSLLYPGKTSSCVIRSAAWSHLELGPKPPLYHIRSHPVSQAPVCCQELRSEFSETLISSISFQFGSENENLSYNLTRCRPSGTLNTAQIFDPPHVLSLWKPKWCHHRGNIWRNAELEKILVYTQII